MQIARAAGNDRLGPSILHREDEGPLGDASNEQQSDSSQIASQREAVERVAGILWPNVASGQVASQKAKELIN
jgi:hypothetical protein